MQVKWWEAVLFQLGDRPAIYLKVTFLLEDEHSIIWGTRSLN
jgi:hypothetical protein